jgi:carbonic anhydrase
MTGKTPSTTSLLEGNSRFRSDYFEHERELFDALARGTHEPLACVIGCSDARVPPDIILGASPGDLFCVRNVANIVPPFGEKSFNRAAGSAIEYAVHALKVRHMVIVGHTQCGGIKALARMDDTLSEEMPTLAQWLRDAAEVRRRLQMLARHLTAEDLERQLVFENVLVQLDNLLTYPVVARALEEDRLEIHGWVYDLADGRIRAYDPKINRFELLEKSRAPAASP